MADPEALKHIMVTNVKNYIKPKLPGSRLEFGILDIRQFFYHISAKSR